VCSSDLNHSALGGLNVAYTPNIDILLKKTGGFANSSNHD